MGFRTLETSQAAELHIRNGQLEVSTKEGLAMIPVEDLNLIMVYVANIRLSTLDISILSDNKAAINILDKRFLPAAIVLSFEGHTRQSKLINVRNKMIKFSA